jgi:GAF domain-containing protein
MELTRRGRPVLIDPAQLGLGAPWQSFAALAPEALVPLVGRSGQMEGLLVLGPRLSEEPYSGEDVALLGSVGTQAGLALENIRLAETMATRLEAERRARHELEIARDVQSKLLPQDRPHISTLDYAGRLPPGARGWRGLLRFRGRQPLADRARAGRHLRGRGFQRRC